MKQFTKEELLELKFQVAELISSDCSNDYKDPVSVYYTSLEVLQYFDSLGEDNVSQIDLQFWAYANQKAYCQVMKVEGEMSVVFKDKIKFEDALVRAQNAYANDIQNKKARKEYCRLVDQSADVRKNYTELRLIAGIYLDVLAEDVWGERYQMWRKLHDRISDVLELPHRGYDADDDIRLSVPELNLLIEEGEFYAKYEKDEARRLHYWLPRIEHLNELIKNRQSE